MTIDIETRTARIARRIARQARKERSQYGAHVAERLIRMAAAEIERMRQRAAAGRPELLAV